jgi:hypothetical protein
MADNNILSRISYEDTVDVRQQSLYARLKKLFSTNVIVRNVGGKKLKIKDSDELMYATDRNSIRDRFNRVHSTSYNAHTRDFSLSYQAARLDLFRDYDCVGPDTIIPLPDGTYPTIAELTEKYKDKPQERFFVFSYDHKTDSIKLGKAYHPRKKKGTRVGYKVTFDNGQYVIGSIKHPFMMRNGEYKMILDLKVGDSVMPFYEKEYNCKYNKYKKLYNFSKGWQSEHVIVAEQFNNRSLTDNEVVHHKNFKGYDNSPENLQIMTKEEHTQFHSDYSRNILWGKENYDIQLQKLKSHPNYINRNIHHWNGERQGENNPFFGKGHTEKSNNQRSIALKEIFKNRDQTGNKNPKYIETLTIDTLKDSAIEYYKSNGKLTSWGLVKDIGCDYSVLQNRLKTNNTDWKTFKNEIETTLNHKIVSIESIGQIDVYDVTVEEYHNFATDSCFVSNTMDMDPIISSALDIYADECLTENEMGEILTIDSKNNNIKDILHNLFFDILNIEFNLWSWIRNMSKYGDFYLKLHISPEYGVYLVEPLSAYHVERIENSDPLNKNYVKFQLRPVDTAQAETLESFQIAHFRLLSDSNFLPYGRSMIEPGRRVWKQLSLLEDAMLIHRIMRAPEKRIFKIDIGNIPPNEIDNFMEKTVSKLKKIPYVDERTGDYNLKFNLQNMVEDFYLPVRGQDSGASIDTLPGMEFTGIDDLEYVKNKMMAALKIPKAFLGFEEGISGKATLAAEDVRFARTINRLQKMVISELTKIASVHLYAQGYRDQSLVDFNISLTNPSTVFEKEKMEIWSSKLDNAHSMLEMTDTAGPFFSRNFVYKKIFKMSDDDIMKNSQDIVEDCKQLWRLKQISEEGNDPAKPFQKINPNADGEGEDGEGGGSGGGAGGGGLPGGGPDLSGETGEEGGEPESEPSEEPLKEVSIAEKHGEPARDYERPSQAGLKKASDYPFGEDPLGDKENNRKSEVSRELVPRKRIESPLTLEIKNVIKNLDSYLSSSSIIKQELLQESTTKSILDEGEYYRIIPIYINIYGF